MTAEKSAVFAEFQQAVNMTPRELESWLQTEDSQAVGQKQGNQESIGHQSGKSIVELLHKKKADYTEADIHQMQRVISYVHRHSAQRPEGDVTHTRWRYSLMNWGHDPCRD